MGFSRRILWICEVIAESKKQKVWTIVIDPKLNQLVKVGVQTHVIPVTIELELGQSIEQGDTEHLDSWIKFT